MSVNKLSNKKRFVGISLLPTVKDVAKKLNELIDWVNGNPVTQPSYVAYAAYLNQSGTNAPVERDIADNSSTALVDDIGGTWSYSNTGEYLYTKVGAFTSAKTAIIIPPNVINTGADVIVFGELIDADTIKISTGKLSQFATPSPFTLGNGYLYLQFIEIRVYN
jgi:hypothetical protein